jgi:hypothetical protein
MPATTTLPYGPAVSLSSALHDEGNTSVIVHGWVPEPQTRGTWSLLYSCTFTIGLCVWTAIHLNIPANEDGPWLAYWRRCKWVLIALLLPELVLFTAWQQFYRAWLLRRDLNQAFTGQRARNVADEESPHNTKDKAPNNSEDKVGQPRLR